MALFFQQLIGNQENLMDVYIKIFYERNSIIFIISNYKHVNST